MQKKYNWGLNFGGSMAKRLLLWLNFCLSVSFKGGSQGNNMGWKKDFWIWKAHFPSPIIIVYNGITLKILTYIGWENNLYI